MTSEMVGRFSQGGRILDLLSDGAEHSNGEIMTAPGGTGGLVGQYQRRLKDLRGRGFAISLGRQDAGRANLWWYSWTDSEQRAAWLAGSTATPQVSAAVTTQTRPVPAVAVATATAVHPASASQSRTRPQRPAASGMMRVTASAEDLGLFAEQG